VRTRSLTRTLTFLIRMSTADLLVRSLKVPDWSAFEAEIADNRKAKFSLSVGVLPLIFVLKRWMQSSLCFARVN
jgi:hypothetical protein